MLWMVVSGEETVERGLRVPLELQQLPAGIELTGDVPMTVDVRERGGSSTLSRVAVGDVVAVLDLRTARAGRRVFPMTADQVKVPFGVYVVQIMPSAMERTLHNLPVHLRNLSPLLAAAATPTSVDVSVRGSRETMARIDGDAIAAFVDLAGLGAGEYQLTVHADPARDAGITHIEP